MGRWRHRPGNVLLALALALVIGTAPALPPAIAAPTVYPTGVTLHDPNKAYQGLNLFIDGTRDPALGRIVLMDMQGDDVQTWPSPIAGATEASHVEPLANGNVLALLRDPSLAITTVVEMDWNGNLVWQYTPPLGTTLHHDFERLANGNTLLLVRRPVVEPTVGPNQFSDDVILEIDPSGQSVWEWSTAANYLDLPLSSAERYYVWLANLNRKFNLFHSNAISTLPPNPHEAEDPRFAAGNVLVSQRDTSTVFIVERSTGQIVWFTRQAIGQHNPQMLPLSLPGGGNILMLDNGGEAGYPPVSRSWSQGLEIDPPSGLPVWTYDPTQNSLRTAQAFFGRTTGGAQRLPNGNTLVTEGTWGRVFEVTSDKEIVWEYLLPLPVGSLYRAVRVDFGWPPVAGVRIDR